MIHTDWKNKLKDKFLRYVQIYTESQAGVTEIPSTPQQWDLANVLFQELKQMGLKDVSIDEHAYVMATLPSNVTLDLPTIGFIAHMDTSPDFTGKNVKPQVWENYDGGDLVLNEEQNIVLSPKEFPELSQFKGETLITTDGTTLLGADDKAGVAEIMTAIEYLLAHPEIPRPTIKIGFTPDEEVGRGADLFDVKKFGADWAYTLDGSKVGEIEYENFNAASAKISFEGKMVHPGFAKGKMINSMLLFHEFCQLIPLHENPQNTTDREGFFHLQSVQGSVESTVSQWIIRDHDSSHFETRKMQMQTAAQVLNDKFGKNLVHCEIKDQYYNMYEKIKDKMYIVELAQQAMQALDIQPISKAIRGGTDGSRLSYMGLPCPNLFAGGMNFHSRYEYVSLEAMSLAMAVIVEIARQATQKLK